jgi:hypothetical protein
MALLAISRDIHHGVATVITATDMGTVRLSFTSANGMGDISYSFAEDANGRFWLTRTAPIDWPVPFPSRGVELTEFTAVHDDRWITINIVCAGESRMELDTTISIRRVS